MKKYVGIMFGAVLLVASCIFAAFQYSSAHAVLVAAETAQVESGSGSVTDVDESLRSEMKELTGYDDARVKTDDMNAESFFRTVMDWKDYGQYADNRKKVIEKGIFEDSYFLKEFFPDITEESYEREFGDGLNLSFGSLESRVVSIKDDVYSYFAVLTVTTETSYEKADGTEQKVAGTGTCVVTYDMDAGGNISNLEGYTI